MRHEGGVVREGSFIDQEDKHALQIAETGLRLLSILDELKCFIKK